MFRSGRGARDPLLPTARGGSRNGGSFGHGQRNHPTKQPLSKSFITTVVWAVVSLMVIASGYLYCQRKVETASVNCDADKCEFVQLRDGVKASLTLPRERLVKVDLVRVKNGEIVSIGGMRRSAQRQLGHSYAIVYAEPDSEDDDDESYDSYEDDDDSYDSYDDSEDSSKDDDDDDVNIIPGSRPTTPKAADRGDRGKTGPSEPKKFPNKRTPEESQESQKRREDQRRKYAEARAARGAKPLHEPDEPPPRVPETRSGNAAAERHQDHQFDRFPGDAGTMEEVHRAHEQRRPETQSGNAAAERHQDHQFHRFPGDAGTMEEVHRGQEQRNNAEIRRMQEQQSGGASERIREERERMQRAYEEASRMHTAKYNMDMMTKQRGNNLHDRALSPDDPDNRPRDAPRAKTGPGLTRQEAQRDINMGADENGQKDEPDVARNQGNPPQELDDEDVRGRYELEDEQLAATKHLQQKAGARSLSAFGGFEEVRERNEYWRGDEEWALEDEFDEGEFEPTEGVLHTRAKGGRRLLSRHQRRTATESPAKTKTKAEIAAAAARDRNVHRKGHGHHHKKARNMATTEETDGDRSTHHHKAFHHKKDVPLEAPHHVHPQYHHKPGQQKVEGGWRHQNRQWHPHEHRTLLATRYNLGRKRASGRKKQMDDYIYKRGVPSGHKSVSFSDTKRWRAGGLWLMIVGLISLVFCLVIGNFQPRPIGKKAS